MEKLTTKTMTKNFKLHSAQTDSKILYYSIFMHYDTYEELKTIEKALSRMYADSDICYNREFHLDCILDSFIESLSDVFNYYDIDYDVFYRFK